MTKEEILTEFGCPDIPFDENVTMYYPAILSAMEEYAQQAISDHEAGKWMKYPENKESVIGDQIYMVTLPDLTVHSCFGMSFDQLHVIAFCSPAPFQEGREG